VNEWYIVFLFFAVVQLNGRGGVYLGGVFVPSGGRKKVVMREVSSNLEWWGLGGSRLGKF